MHLIGYILAAVALAAVVLCARQILLGRIRRLTRELDRANLERSVKTDNIVGLYEASQATSQEVEPGGIMDTLTDDTRRIVGCQTASVAIFVEKDILASVTKGVSNEFKRNLRWRVRPGGMTDFVLSTGKPLVIGDGPTDPRSKDSSAVRIGKLRSIMAVPLISESEVFGVLYLGDASVSRFSDHDLMLASILANHAAASLRQARLQRELTKKVEELEDAHRELVGADRLKTEFISTVTSEMRVPLDAIRTYSQTLLERVDEPSFPLRKKFLTAVVEESLKLLSAVNGVIDLSRMEFGEGDVRREEVKIESVIKDVCGILEPVCADKGVDIMVEIPDGVGTAYLDKDMIFLLVRNLLEAATSFARPGTPVRLDVTEDDEFMRVGVSLVPSATAINMEEAIRAIWGNRLIPPEAGSLGLSLQVCRNIVLRHGGRIWSETHDPASWNFIVLLGRQRRSLVPSDLTFEILTSRPEMRRMLALVADLVSRVMDVGSCFIFLEDPATGRLVMQAGVGDRASQERRLGVDRGAGATGKVFDRGSAIILNSPGEAADLLEGEQLLRFEKIPCAAVPIKTEGRAVGVLTVSARQGADPFFGACEAGLLAALGDRIAVALERSTSYESARDQFVAAMTAIKAILEARRSPSGPPGAGVVTDVPTVEASDGAREVERTKC